MPYKDPELRQKKSYERTLKWRAANPELAKQRLRNWQDRNPDYFLWASAKRRAARDGVQFTITRADIPPIPEICPIALIPIKKQEYAPGQHRGPSDSSPSLDRIDCKKGYVPGNIRVVSHKGNRWKSDMCREDVQRILDYIDGKL